MNFVCIVFELVADEMLTLSSMEKQIVDINHS